MSDGTSRMLLWSIEETAGFDSAWASIDGDRLRAQGLSCGLRPTPYWVSYTIETGDGYVTRRVTAGARWQGGSATLE